MFLLRGCKSWKSELWYWRASEMDKIGPEPVSLVFKVACLDAHHIDCECFKTQQTKLKHASSPLLKIDILFYLKILHFVKFEERSPFQSFLRTPGWETLSLTRSLRSSSAHNLYLHLPTHKYQLKNNLEKNHF